MYTEFYNLNGRPFQLTPDPRFYVDTQTHRKAMAYLTYGLGQGEGFIIITGDVGAGKTTLVGRLLQTIDRSKLVVANIVTSLVDADNLLKMIATGLGINAENLDVATLLTRIENFLRVQHQQGRRVLLIVDEAQNLPIGSLEQLRMLSNFSAGAQPLSQTILLGQPEFREKLASSSELEQLRQRVIATHHLSAMEPKEVQPYIEHRMTCVGWAGNPAFDERLFGEIYDATGGIPRRINQILNRLLLLGSVEQRTRIDGVMLQTVLDELSEDGAIAAPAEIVEPAQPLPVAEAVAQPVAGPSHDAILRLEASMAERDSQIVELQQAVIELANAAEDREDKAQAAHADSVERLNARIAALEAQLGEQDRTIRHTLTMLIEFIESGEGQREAA